MRRRRRVLGCLVLAVAAVMLVSGPSQQAFSHQWHPPARDAARPQSSPGPVQPAPDKAAAAFGRLPLHFEAHETEGTFLTRGGGYTLVLRPSEVWLSLEAPAPDPGLSEVTEPAPHIVRMQLLDAASNAQPQGLTPLPGKVHYLLGNDPSKWRTGISTFGKVQYRNVYPGIDLIYYGNQNKLEFDFIVAPNKAPETIKLVFRGAERARIDSQGDLVLGTGAEEIRLLAPVLYQDRDGQRQPVTGSYVLDRQIGSDTDPVQVSFAVGAYDTTRPLVIDPVLEYSSYLGWAGWENPTGISRDDAGDLYVTGVTNSAANPPILTLGSGGGTDAFVAKLDPTGPTLEYITFFGGSLNDTPKSIVGDPQGVVVAGYTSSTDFPLSNGPFSNANSGVTDGFVTRIAADGSSLLYSTYLGGSGRDIITDVKVKAFEQFGGIEYVAYVTGNTESADFPTRLNAEDLSLGELSDAFMTQIKMLPNCPNFCGLLYSTYLGGADGPEIGLGIAVTTDSVFVTGQTCSNDFATTADAFDTTLHGACDAFVTRYDDSGGVDYSTYIGGSNSSDMSHSIFAQTSNSVLITGVTRSPDFPTKDAAFMQYTPGGTYGFEAFVVRLDNIDGVGGAGCTIEGLSYNNCDDLAWSSYLGGSGDDVAYDVTMDLGEQIYVTGQTCSTDFPLEQPLAQDAVQGINVGALCDAFISTFVPDGSALVYSTYLGGSAAETGTGIVADGGEFELGYLSSETNAYVIGSTESADFPLESPLQATSGGGGDGFVAKLTVPAVPCTGGGAFAYPLPSVLETTQNCVTDEIPGTGGVGTAVSPSSGTAGHAAQVYQVEDKTISFIDPASQQITTALQNYASEVGFQGTAVSPDGTRLYVTDHCDCVPGYIYVFDTQTQALVDTLEYGANDITASLGPAGIAVHPDGEKLYIQMYHAEYGMYAIDVKTKQSAGIALPNAADDQRWSLVITPDGKWVYAANGNQNGSVSIVDTSTDTWTKDIAINEAVHLAVTPNKVPPYDYLVYVAGRFFNKNLEIIDTASQNKVASVSQAGSGPIGVSPDGTQAYVVAGSFVKVIDVATNQWLDSLAVGPLSPNIDLGLFMGPDDTDADGVIDQVDSDPSTFSNAFSDGTSSGTIVDRADQTVSVWDAFENGLYANARGGTQKATIEACTIDILLDQNDAVKFLCGSLTLEVFAGAAEVDLGAGNFAAVPTGGEVQVEQTFHSGPTGEHLLKNLGTETVSVVDEQGSALASLAAGEAQFWPNLPTSTVEVSGVAQGGQTNFEILGVALTVTTTAGESAEDVAAGVVAAILAEPGLVGVNATAIGNLVSVGAPVTNLTSGDLGIQISLLATDVPALSASLLALLVLGLLLAGSLAARSRRLKMLGR